MIVKNNLLNYKNAYIYQDTEYFKMSLDSLLLAKFVTINMRDKKILDLATGNAPIPMLLTYMTKAHIYGVEIQKEIYYLGRISINENKMTDQITLINDDVNNLINTFESDTFDVITCNPPYFRVNEFSNLNNNMIKSIARHEIEIKLEDICRISKKLLKNNGSLVLVHRTDRLSEIINMLLKYNLQPKRIRFLYPKELENSNLVLIDARKNGNIGLKVLPPLICHNMDGSYTKEVLDMFRR